MSLIMPHFLFNKNFHKTETNTEFNKLKYLYSIDNNSITDNIKLIDLFKGFTKLKAVTFSSSLNTLISFLSNEEFNFEDIELIIGLSKDYDTNITFTEFISQYFADNKLGEVIEKTTKKANIKIYYCEFNHSKIYLLSNEQGQTRVITGSSNFSDLALIGKQIEINVYSDNQNTYNVFDYIYQDILNNYAKLVHDFPKQNIKVELKYKKEQQKQTQHKLQVDITKFLIDSDSLKRIQEEKEQEISKMHIEPIKQNLHNILEKEEFKKSCLLATAGNVDKATEKIIQLLVPSPTNTKEEEENSTVDLLSYSEETESFIYYGNNVLLSKPNKDNIKETIDALNEFLDLAKTLGSIDNAKFIGEAITFAFASAYLPFVRQKAHLMSDLPSIPVIAMLAGIAGAGKTTTLEVINKLLYANNQDIILFDKLIKTIEGKSKRENFTYLLDKRINADVLPLLVDEVKPQALKGNAIFLDLVKNATNSKETGRCLIFTSNLNDLSAEREVLRRVCFLPFRHPLDVKEHATQAKQIIRRISNALFISYLQTLSSDLKHLQPNMEDPLEYARNYLKTLGISVPDTYQGNYKNYIRKRWEILYQTNQYAFEEIEFPDKQDPNKIIKCFKVDISNMKPLLSLEDFLVEFINKDVVIIDKEKFLNTISQNIHTTSNTNDKSLIEKIKQKFTRLYRSS